MISLSPLYLRFFCSRPQSRLSLLFAKASSSPAPLIMARTAARLVASVTARALNRVWIPAATVHSDGFQSFRRHPSTGDEG